MTISGATLEPQAQAHVSDECRTADHLAIVLVHGVGYQQQGETLLAWSGRLIRTHEVPRIVPVLRALSALPVD